MFPAVLILAIVGSALSAPAPQLQAAKGAAVPANGGAAKSPTPAGGVAGALGGLGGIGGGAGGILDGVFKTAGIDAPIDLSALGNPAGALGAGGATPVAPANNFANAKKP
ncbi:protein of unknown function [Taphrina deformans PYCC 5710]|uniref:Uncharacterized protein n=1 Tax=Taphrina deformans (strain PYCC 5710 / ATCC 11124 / CBS 356.35 / IMI 108563 / JCM 9778 / NBRC 8474) TaxID=1097556 RepID=R4X837_TAPDE|nr:protein of unknown function [Taphrina deformans PYCC 5710]|eukprot:CCG81417.1 protein of unknown function [Taphrina deformans PYCC 5710]